MAQNWERLAGKSGGTIASLASATTADGGTRVFAATAIGLHESLDGGQTWTSASIGGIAPFVEVVAASPNFARDQTLFVGTRDGLYRSLDSGQTWQLVLVGSRMLSIALAPGYARENLLFVGTETDGCLRSPDAGVTWTSSNPGLLDLTVLAIALSPEFETDQTGFVATATGLYRTRNGGKAWRAVDLTLDEIEEPAVQCLAVSPSFAEDGLALAGTEANGLLISTDGGVTWELAEALAERGVTAIAFSPNFADNGLIAVATAEGVAISRDRGETWTLSDDLGPVLSLLAVNHDGQEALVAGLPRRGIARSTDGGQTWTEANDGLSAHLLVGLTVPATTGDERILFAAGLEDGVLASTDGGVTWEQRVAGLEEPTVFSLVASPGYARDRTLYAATAAGVFRGQADGSAWQPLGGNTARETAGALAVAVGQQGGPPILVAALPGGRLLRSEDDGATWKPLGQPFGESEIIALALSPSFARDATMLVAASKPLDLEGNSELVLWRSPDGGQRWERWLITQGQNVMPIALPPNFHANGQVFVGAGGQVMKPMPKIQEIRGGARRPMWHEAEVSPAGAPVTALAVSPAYQDDATVYAATSDGVYVSRDGGESFAPWNEGLDPASVVALALSPDYADDRTVYAIGLGGAIWRRRDE